ncbi:beta strand repeat-containing protein [Deinococcus sp. SL84]|uniref:beta strand repeat-containing protein n=1 Tax=Deinococcus sp. SL84 TaxID=2994663 RepID=UPI002273D3C9|nr:hypothetical protein [Deinococcus sp. SL84]MCY1701517.1 hypothetical protein [Deinococcus sp. SL84]
MQTNKTLALLAALTLGAASAQTLASAPTTTAGTTISNTASASFTNPATNTTASTQSNTVTTTVLPRAAFDVTYLGGNDSATTNAPAGAPTEYQRAVLPGTTVSFQYVAVNNGNTTQNIALTSAVTGDVSNVRFYSVSADTNKDGSLSAAEIAAATAITSVTVAPNGDDTTTAAVENNNGTTNFFMVYTVNATAAPKTVVGATPVGTGQEFDGTANVQKTETATDLFFQYSRITVQDSGALIGPRNDADGNGTPQTAPYTDAAGNTVTPTASDSQQSNVRAGVTSVTFTNTLQNSGDATDNFTVTSSTAGTVFLTPTGAQVTTSPTTVSITPANGTAAYDVTYTLVGGNLVISGLRAGDSASFQNTIPFSDVTPNVSDTQTTTLTVASANNPERTDTTTNIIRDPGLQFGDNTPSSTAPDAAYNPNPPVQPGATVTFPMQIVNTGGATDTFTVQPTTVTFPVVGGGTVTVPVTYATDTNCDGVADGTGSTLTLASGAQGCFVATVVVPENATSGTTSPITQTVTTGSGLTSTDTNNTINVQVTNGNVALAKFIQGGNGDTAYAGITAPSGYTTRNEALPGTNLNYAIIAKNNFNAPISNFFVCDSVPMNTTFVSVSGGGLYSTDKGATWSSAAPTSLAAGTPTAQGGEVCVAPAGNILPAGGTFRADFTVRVN